MSTDRLQNVVSRVKKNLRVTKVVATRSVKTQRGDFFVGFSAAYDSVQDDQGSFPDGDLTVDSDETTESAMTMEEARVAHILLSMEATIAAWRSVHAEGIITEKEFNDRKAAIKRSHASLLSSALNGQAPTPTHGTTEHVG